MSCIFGRSRKASKRPTSKDPGLVNRKRTPAASICSTINSPPVPLAVRLPDSGSAFVAAAAALAVDSAIVPVSPSAVSAWMNPRRERSLRRKR